MCDNSACIFAGKMVSKSSPRTSKSTALSRTIDRRPPAVRLPKPNGGSGNGKD